MAKYRLNIIPLFALLILSLAGCVGPGANTRVTPATSKTSFPTIEGENLLGEPIQLPRDLKGSRILLITAYRHEQQGEVDTWINKLDELRKTYGDFEFYEIPVIEGGSAMFRMVVNNGMRSGIKGEARRRAVVTVFTTVSDFLKSLNIPDTSQVDVFVLKQGEITGRTRGIFSADSAKEILDRN